MTHLYPAAVDRATQWSVDLGGTKPTTLFSGDLTTVFGAGGRVVALHRLAA